MMIKYQEGPSKQTDVSEPASTTSVGLPDISLSEGDTSIKIANGSRRASNPEPGHGFPATDELQPHRVKQGAPSAQTAVQLHSTPPMLMGSILSRGVVVLSTVRGTLLKEDRPGSVAATTNAHCKPI